MLCQVAAHGDTILKFCTQASCFSYFSNVSNLKILIDIEYKLNYIFGRNNRFGYFKTFRSGPRILVVKVNRRKHALSYLYKIIYFTISVELFSDYYSVIKTAVRL